MKKTILTYMMEEACWSTNHIGHRHTASWFDAHTVSTAPRHPPPPTGAYTDDGPLTGAPFCSTVCLLGCNWMSPSQTIWCAGHLHSCRRVARSSPRILTAVHCQESTRMRGSVDVHDDWWARTSRRHMIWYHYDENSVTLFVQFRLTFTIVVILHIIDHDELTLLRKVKNDFIIT
jgi:hypothetical protein